MWFGTQDRAGWIETPQTGADVGAVAWGESGTLINGGGYAFNSFNSHKEYVFEWRSTSSREAAQEMMSYYSGTYGRGKLYFQDPLTYTTNVLPARWADPSITCDFEGASLIPGVEPERVKASSDPTLKLPVYSARYTLPATGTHRGNHVFIPIPDGYFLVVGAFYSASTPDTGVYVAPVSPGGVISSNESRVTPSTPTELFTTPLFKLPGVMGAALWLGKPDSAAGSTLTVNAIHARLLPVDTTANTPAGENYWVGGQGNEGVRFMGPPTYINNTGRDGGQVQFAASFTESVI